MSAPSTKVVQLFPNAGEEPFISTWRRREMDRDVASLQDLLGFLQEIRAPFRQASEAFVSACANDARDQAELQLTGLGNEVDALGRGIEALIAVMASHQPSADHVSSLAN